MEVDKKICVICGSRDIMAKIEGKYYCYKCGAEIVKEKVWAQVKMWKEKNIDRDEAK